MHNLILYFLGTSTSFDIFVKMMEGQVDSTNVQNLILMV